MADESFVENAIDLVTIVNGAVGLTDDTRPLRRHLNFRHGVKLRAGAKDGKQSNITRHAYKSCS
jgi:hypothetical protein